MEVQYHWQIIAHIFRNLPGTIKTQQFADLTVILQKTIQVRNKFSTNIFIIYNNFLYIIFQNQKRIMLQNRTERIQNALIMVIVCGKSVHAIIRGNGSIGAQVVISIVARMDVFISWLIIIPIRATIQIKSYLLALRPMDGFIRVQSFVRVARKCVHLSLVHVIKTAISGRRHLRSISIPGTIYNVTRDRVI